MSDGGEGAEKHAAAQWGAVVAVENIRPLAFGYLGRVALFKRPEEDEIPSVPETLVRQIAVKNFARRLPAVALWHEMAEPQGKLGWRGCGKLAPA